MWNSVRSGLFGAIVRVESLTTWPSSNVHLTLTDAYVAGNGAAPRDRLRTSLGCAIRDETGERRRLPLGALLEESDTLEEGEALSPAICRRVFPRDPSVVAETALERFAGAPYQWGGVTPWGADCSGFVQTVFALHAVPLPRDAWQQAEAGEPVEGDFWALRPADLLFFSDREDRRITHVGLALGPMRMVHLALGRGGYAVEQLDDEDDAYVKALRERYVFARRVIGAHEHTGKPNLVVVRP